MLSLFLRSSFHCSKTFDVCGSGAHNTRAVRSLAILVHGSHFVGFSFASAVACKAVHARRLVFPSACLHAIGLRGRCMLSRCNVVMASGRSALWRRERSHLSPPLLLRRLLPLLLHFRRRRCN